MRVKVERFDVSSLFDSVGIQVLLSFFSNAFRWVVDLNSEWCCLSSLFRRSRGSKLKYQKKDQGAKGPKVLVSASPRSVSVVCEPRGGVEGESSCGCWLNLGSSGE